MFVYSKITCKCTLSTSDVTGQLIMESSFHLHAICFISSPEPKAQGELIVWDSSRRPCVHLSTLSNINISETSWPIIFKFHQKHHWGRGLTILGFRLDRIRTLVSMATDSSHRVIMGKIL